MGVDLSVERPDLGLDVDAMAQSSIRLAGDGSDATIRANLLRRPCLRFLEAINACVMIVDRHYQATRLHIHQATNVAPPNGGWQALRCRETQPSRHVCLAAE